MSLYKALHYFPIPIGVSESFTLDCVGNQIYMSICELKHKNHIRLQQKVNNSTNSNSTNSNSTNNNMTTNNTNMNMNMNTNFMKTAGTVIDSYYFHLLHTNQTYLQQIQFLQFFPTINIYTAILLLSSFGSLQDLVSLSRIELIQAFSNQMDIDREYLEEFYNLLHVHIGIQIAI